MYTSFVMREVKELVFIFPAEFGFLQDKFVLIREELFVRNKMSAYPLLILSKANLCLLRFNLLPSLSLYQLNNMYICTTIVFDTLNYEIKIIKCNTCVALLSEKRSVLNSWGNLFLEKVDYSCDYFGSKAIIICCNILIIPLRVNQGLPHQDRKLSEDIDILFK